MGPVEGVTAPVDYLVVEFPDGVPGFDLAMARELASLVDAEMVRLLDLVVLEKALDGTVSVHELDDVLDGDDLLSLGAQVAEVLAFDEVIALSLSMAPGSVAGVIVWENVWLSPLAGAATAS
nr:DUF6325 family protein [Microthrixaceae bacterium]